MILNLPMNAAEPEPARGTAGSSTSADGAPAGEARLPFALLLAADQPVTLPEDPEILTEDALSAALLALAVDGNVLPPAGGGLPLQAGTPAGMPAGMDPLGSGAQADSMSRIIGMVRALHGLGGELPGQLAGETLRKPEMGGIELAETLRSNLITSPPPSLSGALQAAAAPQAAAPTPPSLPISIAPGRPDWSEAVGQRVLWMVSSKTQFAELRLNPPDLGPVEVRVRLDDDGLKLHFAAGNAAVREALDAATPRLREMFLAEGLRLDDVAVGHRQTGADPRADGDREGSNGDGAAGSEDGEIEAAGLDDTGRQRLGLVDCFV